MHQRKRHSKVAPLVARGLGCSSLVVASVACGPVDGSTLGGAKQKLCTVEDCPDPPPTLCASYCQTSFSCDTPCMDAARRQLSCGDIGKCACTASLTASPTTVVAGQATQLTWSASEGCTQAITLNDVQVSRPDPPPYGASGAAYATPPAGAFTYSLKNGSSLLATASVSVLPRQSAVPTSLTKRMIRLGFDRYDHLYDGGGEAQSPRTLTGSAAAATPLRSLLAFAHLTDLHVVDDQSPMRLPYLDRLAITYSEHHSTILSRKPWPTNSAYFPHEVLTSQLADAMVRAIRSVGTAPATSLPVAFTVLSGDGTDNTQYNETRSYINILDGGVVKTNSHPHGFDEGMGAMTGDHPEAHYYWHAESYTDIFGNYVGGEYADDAHFPNMPGLYAAARRPFVATGLGMPWYACMGNHDVEVQGNMPIDYLDHWYNPYKTLWEIARGDERIFDITGLPYDYDDADLSTVLGDILTLNLPHIHIGAATANPDRRPLSRSEFVAEHFNTTGNAGHGFTPGSAVGYYSFSTGPGSLFKFIALDSNNTKQFGSNGWVDNDQFTWLENQLKASSSRYRDTSGRFVTQAGVRDQLIVVYSHHPLDSLDNITYTTQCPPPHFPGNCVTVPLGHGTEEVKQLLLRYPNVVLMLAGHIHTNRIKPFILTDSNGTNGFWEVATSALSDWPSQSRLVELGVRPDGANGTLSIFTTMLDADAPMIPSPPSADGTPMNLASIARELAANDFQQTLDNKEGSIADRNAELQLPAPFVIPTGTFPPTETFDEIAAPALPTGWNTAASSGNGWIAQSDGTSNMASVDDPPVVTDKWLESPAFTPVANQRLTFTQTVNLENTYDGAVLEISIDGGAYQDVVSAGGQFVTGGYTATISSSFASPIAGRSAWTGSSAPRQSVQIALPPSAVGRATRVRWRVATDSSVGRTGYSFDDVNLVVSTTPPPPSGGGGGGCTPDPSPCPTTQCAGTASDGCGGQVACHADCSLNGLCSCRGGSCVSNFCSCSSGPCF